MGGAVWPGWVAFPSVSVLVQGPVFRTSLGRQREVQLPGPRPWELTTQQEQVKSEIVCRQYERNLHQQVQVNRTANTAVVSP